MGAHSAAVLPRSSAVRVSAALIAVAAVAVAGSGWLTSPAAAAAPPTTFAELQTAVTAGGTVQLGGDIVAPAGSNLVVPTGDPVTLDLAGHDLTIAAPASGAAAIAVTNGSGLVIDDTAGGGALTAQGGAQAAGIGGSPSISRAVGNVTIGGGTVTARGGDGAAGIGGAAEGLPDPGSDTRSVTISGGSVTALGGSGGAGIGGGNQGSDVFTVAVKGGTVTATGGSGAAGIGSGTDGVVSFVDLLGGTVDATGSSGGAGIGGGENSVSSTQVKISSPSDVTARAGSGVSAIGLGRGGGSSTTLVNDATLTIPTGAELTVDNGTWANTGVLVLGGTLNGTGDLRNDGTILPGRSTPPGTVTGGGAGPAGTALRVSRNNFVVGFDVNGGTGTTPASLHPYASTLSNAELSLPAGPTPPAHSTFTGWFTAASGGSPVTDTSDLASLAGQGPATLTLYAQYAVDTSTVTFDAAGGTPAPAPQKVAYGGRATEPSAPTKSGSTFTGWFTAAGARFDFTTDEVTADLTLTARYTPIVLTVTDSGGAVLTDGATVDAGARLTVAVSGLAPSTEYTLTARSTPVAVGTITTDTDGAGEVTVTLPSDLAAGEHRLTVDTTGTGATSAASFTFTVPTSPSPSPSPTPSASESSTGVTSPVNPAGSANGTAQTGSDVAATVGLGTALLFGGLVLIVGSRRRPRHLRR